MNVWVRRRGKKNEGKGRKVSQEMESEEAKRHQYERARGWSTGRRPRVEMVVSLAWLFTSVAYAWFPGYVSVKWCLKSHSQQTLQASVAGSSTMCPLLPDIALWAKNLCPGLLPTPCSVGSLFGTSSCIYSMYLHHLLVIIYSVSSSLVMFIIKLAIS